MAALEAVNGKITLSTGLMALIWVIALGIVGAAGASAVTSYQVRDLLVKMERHERLPIHHGARYEVNDLLRRLSRIDKESLRQIPESGGP